MNVLEIMLMLVFVVPIIAGSVVFVICAGYMQEMDNQRSGQKQGFAESV